MFRRDYGLFTNGKRAEDEEKMRVFGPSIDPEVLTHEKHLQEICSIKELATAFMTCKNSSIMNRLVHSSCGPERAALHQCQLLHRDLRNAYFEEREKAFAGRGNRFLEDQMAVLQDAAHSSSNSDSSSSTAQGTSDHSATGTS